MPTPNDVPKRPSWRYSVIHVAGRSVVPAAITDEDRMTVLSRLNRDENNDDQLCTDDATG